MKYDELQRIPVYPSSPEQEKSDYSRFLIDSGNWNFRRSLMTWFSLSLLLLFYPGISLAFMVDPSELATLLNDTVLMLTLISTIIMQWSIFLVLYVTTYREQTGLRGIGFTRIRGIYVAWAVAFLLASNLILAGLAWLLAQVGLPMPGEIKFLIPTDPTGRVVWVIVSITAGICEETAFRGYLMTRLRILGKTGNWLVPTVVSAAIFGACHAYQGIPGFILISVYGAMFSWLYIRTGSLWPGIIAHSLQDLGALLYPH